jgi:L-aminoadipate-semialdehyde dehydrogenase
MSTVQISSQQVDRWRTRLSNLTEFQLPSDYPRPLPPKFVDSVETKVLSETTSLSLLQLSLTNHVTDTASGESHPASPFLCLLTAFGVLLHKYTGEEDIVVGSSSNSANPLVLRLPIKSEHTFSQLLQTVHEVIPIQNLL